MSIIKVKTGGITADAITDALIADDVVGTEHLTANEVDTTALGADAVTAAQIADDAVSDEHLDVTSITGQTAETSVADGDTLLIHDASASALRKMTKANFVSGVGGTNTPAFEAYLSSAQVIGQTTATKININTERFDTANAYDNSTNYRFTPQTAGKYFVYAHLNLQTAGKKVANAIPSIYKNGSNYTQSASNFADDTTSTIAIGITNIITMNGSSDYLEVYAYMESYDSAEVRITPELAGSYFGAFLIIE